MLQSIVRPTEVSVSHFEALGVHVIPDASLAQLMPDPAFVPDFEAWHALSPDEVHAINESTRRRLNTGNLSPGCQTYLDRRRELSITNEDAYRTVRRIPPPKGQQQPRLGNSYEFYRYLEIFTTFWDDTSQPPAAETKAEDQAGESNGEAGSEKAPESETNGGESYRTSTGSQMPVDLRQNMVNAFIKLVAYDFTCNVSAARTEPRLHITSRHLGTPRSSYFSSGCAFLFRSPTTREDARAGIVEGPLAAVSARHTTSFAPPDSTGSSAPDRESILDLARELVAALITAQHRAREGRTEKRIGENAWWATKPRWGGGPGGPIGREVEMLSGADETIGDKDAPPPPEGAPQPQASSSSSRGDGMSLPRRPFSSRNSGLSSPLLSSSSAAKGAKRLKKSGSNPMYDNYRMVRPPAANWDSKTRYQAIGRVRGVDYDDIFVISTLFHHISIVRVRVPDRLLAVLDGEPDDYDGDSGSSSSTGSGSCGGAGGGGGRSWGKLQVWRSPWFDFFKVEDRLKALQIMWCMMSFLMREVPKDGGDESKQGQSQGQTQQGQAQAQGQGDVKMTGT